MDGYIIGIDIKVPLLLSGLWSVHCKIEIKKNLYRKLTT